MKVYLLHDGYFGVDLNLFLPALKNGPYQAAAKSLLVLAEKEKILVDTGVGNLPDRPEYDELRRRSPVTRALEQSLIFQLKSKELTPDDISLVVNTHLHMTHSGNNKLFKRAKFFVSADELKYIDSLPNPHLSTYLRENYEGIDFILLNGKFRLMDGVTVIPTPGHTPGHCSVIIKEGSTNIVHAGDVFPLRENYDRMVPMKSFDAAKNMESMKKLAMIKNSTHIFSHDSEQLTL